MLEKDFNYQEGLWAAKGMAKNIGSTTYGSLEEAIRVKSELISEFEEKLSSIGKLYRQLDQITINHLVKFKSI